MVFSMCVQLDLFSGVALQEPVEFISESEFRDMAQRADITDAVVGHDPCRLCRYFGLCDSDECAMKCYRLDSKVYPRGYSYKYGF